MSKGKKALIVAFGSRGDVAPTAGVGARLREAGYDVTLAADKAFATLVEDAGLGFHPLIGDARAAAASELHSDAVRDGMASRSGAKLLKAAKQFIRALNINVAGITADSGADIVLFNALGAAAYHVAQARGIPSVGLHLQPQQPTAELPPTTLGHSLGRLGNRLATGLIRLFERMYFADINDIRAEHDLPPTTPAATYRKQAAEQWPILHGISRHVVPRPRDWRPGLEIVGYWWPTMPSGWTPPEDLRRFLDAGPPPVFVGLGSTNPGNPEHLSGVVTAALRRAGQRGVIQAGWAELSTSDDDMLTIGDVPHEWLFPRMATVVHAAGAGTTAAGLRAGVPTVPVPVTRDGPFWSYRLTTLGVSPGAIRFKKLTIDSLADAVREAVTNPVYTRRATELATNIATEDGAGQVLTTVTNLT
ncbi:glycosyltransferase [Amycolatopsis taiwanensis]|uniref:glycosyltransferase n=1 Tax=Amycolatopsis taiwanensis TaxID=342230 RepID=UPI0004AE9A48|nr:glycosyltransferase [Amycolatopsis taiwanensis]